MRPTKYISRICIDQPKEQVVCWHMQRGSFSRSFPSWERLTIDRVDDLSDKHRRIFCHFKHGPFKIKHVFRSHNFHNNEFIRTILEKGPFRYLTHEIEVKSNGIEACELVEKIEFNLSCPWFFLEFRIKRYKQRLKRFFSYKHDVLIKDLAFFQKLGVQKRKKILVSGSSGLIGSNLSDLLRCAGHDVWVLVRSKEDLKKKKSILFDRLTGEIEREKLEGFDAVVHLGGQNINTRWTRKKKEELIASRFEATKSLAKILGSLYKPPKAFLCASAVGFYGDRGDQLINEKNLKGSHSFLSDICQSWENACGLLKSFGVRVVHLRFGMVLSSQGGALKKMLLPFKMGIGGVFGEGEQFISWIALDDVTAAIYQLIVNEKVSGPVNIVSQRPLSNKDFSLTLAKHLGKNLGPNIPKGVLRLLKGQMADELLLTSLKVEPKKLVESGYRFRYPTLEDAFAHLIF